jgi:hypothetical protein
MEGNADANKDKKITSGELHEYVLANVARDPGDHDGMRRGV